MEMVLEALSLREDRNAAGSLVPDIFQMSPVVKSHVNNLEQQTRIWGSSRTADQHFLRACFPRIPFPVSLHMARSVSSLVEHSAQHIVSVLPQ